MTVPTRALTDDDRTLLAEVGRRLRAERVRQRYKQTDIGAMLGIHQAAISMMELGNQNIPLPTYLSWCDALGVEPWELLGWR